MKNKLLYIFSILWSMGGAILIATAHRPIRNAKNVNKMR